MPAKQMQQVKLQVESLIVSVPVDLDSTHVSHIRSSHRVLLLCVSVQDVELLRVPRVLHYDGNQPTIAQLARFLPGLSFSSTRMQLQPLFSIRRAKSKLASAAPFSACLSTFSS